MIDPQIHAGGLQHFYRLSFVQRLYDLELGPCIRRFTLPNILSITAFTKLTMAWVT